MKSITRFVTAVVAVLLTVAILCPAQDVTPKNLGKGAAFNGKKIEMKDKGEVAYRLSFTAGKEFEATTDGPKKTDVHLVRLRLLRYGSREGRLARTEVFG